MGKGDYHTGISVGNRINSFEELQVLCQEEAKKLSKSIEITNQETISIPFWTSDIFPELIGVGHFRKNENGLVVFELDFSETTL